MLSAPLSNLFPGQESFKGQIFHTARWPREPVELAGKRVGVIGTGATGIQVIQTIAAEVGQLKVFVRTPQYALPMKNPKFAPEDIAAYKARYDELRRTIPNTMSGFNFEVTHRWDDLSPEERRQVLEEAYSDGSLKFWLATFGEMFVDDAVNAEISEFIRQKMRARLQDEHLCDVLIPRDFGFGTHRVPLETSYFEAFRRENVEAIPVKHNPIVAVVPEGLRLADGTVHELDVIIMATGFDAGTGALTRIDIRGRDGRSLREAWSRDITTTLGLQISGYPNLFTTAAPLAPSAALCNMTTCLQQQTEWITDCIRHLRESGKNVMEPTAEMEAEWVRHHEEVAAGTLMIRTDSYYLGSNVPGKPRRLLAYAGGVGTYRQKCAEVAASGYAGFTMR